MYTVAISCILTTQDEPSIIDTYVTHTTHTGQATSVGLKLAAQLSPNKKSVKCHNLTSDRPYIVSPGYTDTKKYIYTLARTVVIS